MWPCRERLDGDEWLDDPRLPPEDVAGNLRDLELVNRLLGGGYAVLAHVEPVLDSMPPKQSVRVLDVACGGGDILRAVARYARRQG